MTKWQTIGVTHRCPDGTTTRQERDMSVPVGQYAPTHCPRCGITRTAQQVQDELAYAEKLVRSVMAVR